MVVPVCFHMAILRWESLNYIGNGVIVWSARGMQLYWWTLLHRVRLTKTSVATARQVYRKRTIVLTMLTQASSILLQDPIFLPIELACLAGHTVAAPRSCQWM